MEYIKLLFIFIFAVVVFFYAISTFDLTLLNVSCDSYYIRVHQTYVYMLYLVCIMCVMLWLYSGSAFENIRIDKRSNNCQFIRYFLIAYFIVLYFILCDVYAYVFFFLIACVSYIYWHKCVKKSLNVIMCVNINGLIYMHQPPNGIVNMLDGSK